MNNNRQRSQNTQTPSISELKQDQKALEMRIKAMSERREKSMKEQKTQVEENGTNSGDGAESQEDQWYDAVDKITLSPEVRKDLEVEKRKKRLALEADTPPAGTPGEKPVQHIRSTRTENQKLQEIIRLLEADNRAQAERISHQAEKISAQAEKIKILEERLIRQRSESNKQSDKSPITEDAKRQRGAGAGAGTSPSPFQTIGASLTERAHRRRYRRSEANPAAPEQRRTSHQDDRYAPSAPPWHAMAQNANASPNVNPVPSALPAPGQGWDDGSMPE